MTLAEFASALDSIPGYSGKVAYKAFPADDPAVPPFVVWYVAYSHNFNADGVVYAPINHIVVELITKKKDPTEEGKIEAKLAALGLAWEKEENTLDDENCVQIIYEMEM